MGCGGSKDGNSDEIKSEMKHTGVPEFDDYFSTAKDVLEALEELRSSFQETRETMNDIGRTEELVEPKFIEALRVFFWSVSAHHKGNIANADIRFELDPPSLTVDCGHMHYVTWEFSDALLKLIGGFTGAPGKIIDITQKIQEIGEKSKELSKDITGTVTGAGLSGLQQMKAVANAGTNFNTIASGLGKAPKVLTAAKEAVTDIKDALPHLKELITKADEVGAKAHEKKIERIDEIFDHFQTAPKKTPEQIKEEKKGKKKKARKGKKPEAKPGQHKPTDQKPAEHKPVEAK